VDRPPLLELLADALPARPAAVMLSGGLDSSLLASLAARRGRLSTAFTLDDDEAEMAALVASHAGFTARHKLVHVTDASLPGDFVAAVRACRAPIINGRAVTSYRLVLAAQRAGETAVVAGLGADELFHGHLDDGAAWRATLELEVRQLERLAGIELGQVTPERVLDRLTLPPFAGVAASLGLACHLPFLAPEVRRLAAGYRRDELVHGGLGKWPVREAAKGLVPDDIRLGVKTARLRPPSARSGWMAVLDEWLDLRRVERAFPRADLRGIAVARAEHAAGGPRFAQLDRTLLGLASRVVLVESFPS
jgi:asparagine synthetase B (glutamine-hydrolysing)